MTTLIQLILDLKHELKHGGGDRELRPDVTVAGILAPAAKPNTASAMATVVDEIWSGVVEEPPATETPADPPRRRRANG